MVRILSLFLAVAVCVSPVFARAPRLSRRAPSKPVPVKTPPVVVQPRMLFDEEFANETTLSTNWSTSPPFGSGLLGDAGFGERQVFVGASGGYGNPNPFAFTAKGLTITAQPIAAASQPALPAAAYPSNYTGAKNLKFSYTSACLSTAGILDFTPPFYVRATIQTTAQPGFCILGQMFGDPMNGNRELDFCQVATKSPTESYVAVLPTSGNETDGGYTTAKGAPNLSAGFHSYGMEVLTTGINWYIDEVLVYSTKQVITGKLFLCFYLQAGDTFGKDSPAQFVGVPSGQPATITISSVQVWNVRPPVVAAMRSGVASPVMVSSKKPIASPAVMPDDLMKLFGQPVVDQCLKDSHYRRELMEQMNRCFGRRQMAELIWLSILDERPDLLCHPLICRAIRGNLGL